METFLEKSPLGQASAYIATYDKRLLFPIARQPKRDVLGISKSLPFKGYDLWTAFELSWLNEKGKPVVAVADFIVPAHSENLIESKSLKLYLNSFNNTYFASLEQVEKTLRVDLSEASGLDVEIKIYSAQDFSQSQIAEFSGFCLDDLDVNCSEYQVNPALLRLISQEKVENETLYSHLLKSNCLVTGQPDWGSIEITYSGPRIEPASLLQYLVSFRNHNEFHEQCVERIFMDLMTHCQPTELGVYARYTRRGGLDINPLRSTKAIIVPENKRLYRQ